MRILRSIFVAFLTTILMAGASRAHAFDLWLAPPDSVAQRSRDFQLLFARPDKWSEAAKLIDTFSFTSSYLLRTPIQIARRQVELVQSLGMKVDVSISAVQVDKHHCGDGVEGVTWTGEPAEELQRLTAISSRIDSFSLDEPLTFGHFYSGPHACKFSIQETAARLRQSIADIRKYYPSAKLFDQEALPKTASDGAVWPQILSEWLHLFNGPDNGHTFSGVMLDISWDRPWTETVSRTVNIIHASDLRAGLFLNSEHRASAAQWMASARQNWCALGKLQAEIDDVVIANWNDMTVPNLPGDNPLSLTALATWIRSDPCR